MWGAYAKRITKRMKPTISRYIDRLGRYWTLDNKCYLHTVVILLQCVYYPQPLCNSLLKWGEVGIYIYSLIYKKGKKTSFSPIMWHRYAKRTIISLCPSSSRCKEVRGQPQRDRGRILGTMRTCEEIERRTHARRASKLGPFVRWWTQDGKLGITIQETPLESGRRTNLLYFTYSYCILSRVWKLATSVLVSRHYKHSFLFLC